MSQLSPFVRAFRALSRSFHDHAADCVASATKLPAGRIREKLADQGAMIKSFGFAFDHAATDLEQQIAADLSRVGRVEHIPSRMETEGITVKPFKVELDVDPEQGSPQPGAVE